MAWHGEYVEVYERLRNRDPDIASPLRNLAERYSDDPVVTLYQARLSRNEPGVDITVS